VLVKIPLKNLPHNDISESSDEDLEATEIFFDWQKRFIKNLFTPAIAKLSSKSLSKLKVKKITYP